MTLRHRVNVKTSSALPYKNYGKPCKGVYTIAPAYDLVLAMRRRRLRYLGHVLRMPAERMVRRALMALVSDSVIYPTGSLFSDCQGVALPQLVAMASTRTIFFFFLFRLFPSGVATADFLSPVSPINCILLRHFNLSVDSYNMARQSGVAVVNVRFLSDDFLYYYCTIEPSGFIMNKCMYVCSYCYKQRFTHLFEDCRRCEIYALLPNHCRYRYTYQKLSNNEGDISTRVLPLSVNFFLYINMGTACQ